MKKILTLTLAALLITSMPFTVLAKENNLTNINTETISAYKIKISEEEAKQIAKEFIKDNFKITVDENFNCNVLFDKYEDLSKNYIWLIKYIGKLNEIQTNIEIWVDSQSGKVVTANIYKNEDEEYNKLPSLTENEALKAAEEFIEKVAPNEFKDIEVSKKYRNYVGTNCNYSFEFIRKVNGIKYPSNYIRITINGISGNVITYYNKWDDSLDLPSASNLITQKEAFDKFKKLGELKLEYKIYANKYDTSENVKPIYCYTGKSSNLIDAHTGKVININGENKKIIELSLNEEEKEELFKNVNSLKEFDKELSQKEAEELINKYIVQFYGEGYELDDLSYSNIDNLNSKQNIKTWSARFTKKQKDDNGEEKEVSHGTISINSKNGAIIYLYNNTYDTEQYKDKPIKLTIEEAYNKAIKFIAENCPDKIKNIDFNQEYYETEDFKDDYPRYYFAFTRVENGIPFPQNRIYINYDGKTGQLSRFSTRWDQFEIPKLEGVIEKEKAEEIFYNTYKPNLSYVDINASQNSDNINKETKLVYSLSNDYYSNYLVIDAFTGKFIDYSGEEIDQNIEEFYKKIQQSKYEKQLSILAYRKIIPTKDFDLNKQITNMDLIKMLVNVKGYNVSLLNGAQKLKFETGYDVDDTDYKYLQMAVQYGMIENKEGEFNAEAKVKRSDMAKIIIDSLGYKKLAQCDDIFKLSLDDTKEIKPEMKGYLSIAKGLNILEVNDNKIRPYDYATMEDLCIAIYNCYGEL